MNFDLSKFKKVSEDKKSAILQHPEGHKFLIAKHVLSPKLRSQISELPLHKADGGPIDAKSEGLAEERARSSDPSFQMQFPEAKVGGSQTGQVDQASQPAQQPIINVNVGGQPQQQAPAQAPVEQAPMAANGQIPGVDYSHGMPFKNGTVDWDAYALQNPSASMDSKMRAMKNLQMQDDSAKANAMAQSKQLDAQREQILQYNQMAAARGLPQLPVPNAPAMAANSQVQTTPMQEDNVPPHKPEMPQAPKDPFGTQAYSDAYMQGLNQQIQGHEQEADALGKSGQEQSNIYSQDAQKRQGMLDNTLNNVQKVDGEITGFMNDYKNQHIDPKHYLSSMGTGQKIATVIGLILGGMGGGLMHQENPALAFLNKRISDDIDAQKADMGKYPTLLEANFKRMGNMMDAAKMTQLMQTEIVKDQISSAAAKSQDPLVRARAQQAIGALNMQAAPIKSQIAMRQAMLSGVQSGNMDPSMAIRMMVPEGQQKEAFTELKEAQEQVKGRDNIIAAFNDLNKTNTLGNRVSSPIQSASQVKALRDLLSVELARAAAGRVNEYEFKAAQDQFPAVGDDADTIKKKMNYLMHFIETKMNHPILLSYGINMGSVKDSGRYDQSGENKIPFGPPVLGRQGSSSKFNNVSVK